MSEIANWGELPLDLDHDLDQELQINDDEPMQEPSPQGPRNQRGPSVENLQANINANNICNIIEQIKSRRNIVTLSHECLVYDRKFCNYMA